MSKPILFTAAGLCLGTTLPALAQTPSALLENITVTANRLEQQLAATAPNVELIDKQQLAKRQAGNLAELLGQQPGISVSNDQGRRGAAGVNIRGIENNRVLMQLDGQRLPEAYLSGAGAISGRDLVEPDTLRDITINKGPSSALFGSDAIGGRVAMQSYAPADFVDVDHPLHAGFKQSYDGSNASHASTLSLAAAGQQVAGMLMLSHRRSHELDNFGNDRRNSKGRTAPDPQLSDSQNLLAKLAIGSEGPHHLHLTHENFKRQQTSQLLSQLGRVSGYGPAYTLVDKNSDDETRRQRHAVEYRYRGNGELRQGSLLAYRQHLINRDRALELRDSGSQREDNRFEQAILGLEGQLQWQLGAHRLLAGFEATRSDTERLTASSNSRSSSQSKTFPDNRSERLAFFLQQEWQHASGLRLTPAIRFDRYRMTPQRDAIYDAANGGANVVRQFSDQALSPRLELALPLAAGSTLFASLNSGFRAPPFDSAFMSFNNARSGYRVLPNADLRSEKARGIELGGKWQQARWQAQLNLFHNRYQDFIDQVRLNDNDPRWPAGSYQYQNRDKVRIHGAEATARWQVAANWQLDASLAWAKGKSSDGPLESVDPLRGKLGLAYSQADWGLYADWQLVAAKRDSKQTLTSPGYGALDLGGHYRLGKQSLLRAKLGNVGDKKYWQWADLRNLGTKPADSLTQPRRHLQLSLETRF